MKIADIVIHIHTVGGRRIMWPRPHRFMCVDDDVYAGLVRIIADDGTEGFAGIHGEPTLGSGFSKHSVYRQASEILGLIKKELVGHDVFDREWLWTQRYVYSWWGHIDPRSYSTIDMGLWDLAGRIAGQPVYELLGACRHEAPCYASGPWFPDPDDHARLAVAAKELGYPAFKIKPGGEPVASIKRITTAVREAVGDDMELMIDGQTSYTFDEALEIGRHLQDLHYKWFEDPVQNTDFAALERLGQRLDIPIGWCDHKGTRFHELTDWIRRPGGPRILRGDCGKDGLTGLKKLCSVADAFGMKCEIHGGGMPNLHVLMSVGNCEYYEDGLSNMTDSLSPVLHRRDESDPYYVDERGYIRAPTAPGMNPPPNLERIAERTVEVLR